MTVIAAPATPTSSTTPATRTVCLGYGPLIATVLGAAFALSLAHTIYSEVTGLTDPGFRLASPLVWVFYLVAFGAAAAALRGERRVQTALVVYLAVMLGISVLYYPSTFTDERQTTFGWIENDLYIGLLMVALSLAVLRLVGAQFAPPPDGSTSTPGVDGSLEPIDVHDMVVVHRAFRRELRVVPELVRSVPSGDTERATVVAAHLRLCLDGVHLHHTSEDDLLWPLLTARSPEAADLVHRMQDQHAAVEDFLEQVEPVLARWVAEARPAVGAELAGIIDGGRAELLHHLDEEERAILPLAARHLDQDEWAAIGQAGVAKMTRHQLPLMFGMVMEDATPAERREMLGVLPRPLRFVLRTWGARHYARYVMSVRHGR